MVYAIISLVLAHFLSNTYGNLFFFICPLFSECSLTILSLRQRSVLHLHLSPTSGSVREKLGTVWPAIKTFSHMHTHAFHNSSFLHLSLPITNLFCPPVLYICFFKIHHARGRWIKKNKLAEFEWWDRGNGMKSSEETEDQKCFIRTSLKGLFIYKIGSSYPGITSLGSSACAQFISWLPKVHGFRRGSHYSSVGMMAGELGTQSQLLLLLGTPSPASPPAIFRHSWARFWKQAHLRWNVCI